jgi:hypothetical protein
MFTGAGIMLAYVYTLLLPRSSANKHSISWS